MLEVYPPYMPTVRPDLSERAIVVPSTCNRIATQDAGTLYMMVTLPNGRIRTRAFPNQPIEHAQLNRQVTSAPERVSAKHRRF